MNFVQPMGSTKKGVWKMEKEGRRIIRRAFLKKVLVAGGIAVIVLGLSAFPQHTLHAQPKEVKVGALVPLTGYLAHWGKESHMALELAAQIINEEGGIKSMGGAKVKVVVADFESKPEVAVIQAERLIADKDILFLTGTNSSAATLAVSPIAERNQICFLDGVDFAQISQKGFKYTFRSGGTIQSLARDIIHFARDMGQETGKAVKKMAILTISATTGIAAGDAAAAFGKAAGFEVVDYSSYDPRTTKDFVGYISKYKSAGVDFFTGFNTPPDAVLIVRAMKELNYNPLMYGGVAGAITMSEFGTKLLGKDSNYLVASCPYADLDIPRNKEIAARYKKQYGLYTNPGFLMGFGVLPVMRAALENYPTYDRKSFRDAVEKVGLKGLKVGEYDFWKIDGLKWDSDQENSLEKCIVFQWVDGVKYNVSPKKYATRKPVWPRPTWDEIK